MNKVIVVLFISCFFVFYSNEGMAQSMNDFLDVFNNKQQPDTIRLKAIGDLAWAYASENPDSGIIFAQQQLKYAQQTNQKKYEAKALASMGKANLNKGNYAQALVYFLKSLKLRESISDRPGIANCYNNIGIIYVEQSNYPKALENYFKALKIREETGDKQGMGDCFTNIGTVFNDQANYSKALEYYSKDLKICQEYNNKEGVAVCYNNIGNVYHNQSDFPKTLENYLKAVKVFEEIDNQPYMASCYNNIGSVYSYVADYKKALEYHLKSLHIKQRLEDKQGEGNCYVNLSALYLKLHDYKQAKTYSDSALKISKEIGDIDNERLSYQSLAEINALTGHFEDAYNFHVKFKKLTDTIFNIENSKSLGDLKTKFEVEKKETELKAEQEKKDVIATAEVRRQHLILLTVTGFGILVLILAIVIFRNLRINQKKNRIITLQKQMVELQKQEVENQKQIVEEHQKEILDSIHYAKRIQDGLLAHQDFLNENLPGNFVFFKSKDIVSGDFYWATKHGSKFYLAVCDSTGHGVPGAFMSLLNIGFLSEAINEKNILEPDEVFNYVRSRLTTTISKEGQKDGFDGILLCFDSNSIIDNDGYLKLTYAAAYNGPVLISNNELKELPKDKMPVGVGERDEKFKLHTIHVKKDDVLYLYTDGYADQFGGEKGKKFKYKQLENLLLNNHQLPLNEQHDMLNHTFENWRGKLEQVDDVCVIGIRF